MALIAEGTYIVRFTDQGLSKTQKGQMYLFFEFDVLAKIESNGDRKEATRHHSRRMTKWLSDAAIEYTLADLKRLGLQFDTFGQFDAGHPRPVSLVGKEAKLYCKHKENKNEFEEQWNVPMPKVKLSDTEISSLDDLVARKRGGAGSATIDEPGAAPFDGNSGPNITDDDLPF